MHENSIKNQRRQWVWLVAVGAIAGVLWMGFHREEVAERIRNQLGIEIGQHEKHYVPEGCIGWISVTYNIPTAPELPIRDGAILFRYGEDGTLETSTPRNDGFKRQDFFVAGDGLPVKLSMAGRGESLLIGDPPPDELRVWHYYTANEYVSDGKPMGRLQNGFFVGTQQQYENAPPR